MAEIKKAIIFDSGTIITFAVNGLLEEFKELKKIFKGSFIITEDVKKEIVDKPLTIKRFELEALKVKQLLNEKVLEMSSAFGINDEQLQGKTRSLRDLANTTFIGKGREIHLIDSGEASCLALSTILEEKGIKHVIAVDERTTRILGEKPENLRNILSNKLHTKIEANENNFKHFRGFRFIRSSELLYVAYKKNAVKIKDGIQVLDALLYAAKFSGCAISGEEIEQIKRMK